ncbi:transcriptional regulator [Roseovarius sp. HI0049]|nr:transcriptional regulator [Roseovarius sp. HI0049]
MSKFSSFAQWYSEGPSASYVHSMKSTGGILSMYGSTQPGQEMDTPAVPDLVIYQDVLGGSRLNASLGGGRFDVTMENGGCVFAAPNFAVNCRVDTTHHIRSFVFPVLHWQTMLDEASEGKISFDSLGVYRGAFATPALKGKLRSLWALCEEEAAPSRMLARAAGCEILAEICQLGGEDLAPKKGGLAPWAERRCIEMMHARLAEDLCVDELAVEARLSSFHFARMFKQSTGVTPLAYLTRLRLEKACELLEHSDIPVTEIAQDVGYSSNQVLARVFAKHMHMSPSDYRRSVRDPVRSYAMR